jgi:hypothetical protein
MFGSEISRERKNHMSVKAHWIKQVKWLTVIIVSLAFLGCGGGSSSGGSGSDTNPSRANGIWHGTFVERGFTYNISALTFDGEIVAYSQSAGAIYMGTYTVSGNQITGTVNGFFIGGGRFTTSTLNGTFAEQSDIGGTFSSSYGTTGTLSVSFDPLFNRPSPLALLEGTWSYTEPGYSISIDVDDQGEINGSDSDGCVFFGVASVLDPEHNTYGIDIDVTNCGPVNDTYSGLAILNDELTLNDTLRYFVYSQHYILFNFLTRQ